MLNIPNPFAELPRKPESDADEILLRLNIISQSMAMQAQLYKAHVEIVGAQLLKISAAAERLDSGDSDEVNPVDKVGTAEHIIASSEKFIRDSARATKAWKTRKARARAKMKAARK